jgi:leucyl aminopeptidase
MLECFATESGDKPIPIIPVLRDAYDAWLARQSVTRRNWLLGTGYKVTNDAPCLLPRLDGGLDAIVIGVDSEGSLWPFGALPGSIPPGDYRVEAGWSGEQLAQAALGWGLGAYRFQGYRKVDQELPRLVLSENAESASVQDQVEVIYLVRDLINTPAADMMPEHLAEVAAGLAERNGAQLHQIVGDELLARGYPAVHAVGRASTRAPRLIDMTWGDPKNPKLTLVGKGVCFDSGGLDIKSSSGMRLMKKDMGGAAHVLGLAQLVMASKLPVRLRMLIPAVENALAGNAFRPGDVLNSRGGLTIEIDNTDAEGRVILCDALAEAVGENPEMIVDFATLTGAARIALGTELPGFFTASESLAGGLTKAASHVRDPVWRLPLFAPYRQQLDSDIADILNSSPEPYGGAITAALFLQAFVPDSCEWVHFDVMAWNGRARPGRPKGGEAMGLRAAYAYLRERFAPTT